MLRRTMLAAIPITLVPACTTMSPPTPTERVDLAQFATEPGERSADVIHDTDPGGGGSHLDDAETVGDDGMVLVNSLVGQINGRPIFADDFFEPIEDELLAEGEGLNAVEFEMMARRIVSGHLQEVVLNELFLAQAESALSVQQHEGLLAWLGEVRNELTRQHRGSRAAAEAALAEEDDTFEDYVEGVREQALIDTVIRREIQPRVIVSWRDVEREYERRYDEFNPPGRVTLGAIRLSQSREADTVDEVISRFDGGASWDEVVEFLGLPDRGLWNEVQLGPAGMGDIQEINEAVRPKLAGLEVGDTTEALELGSSVWWFHVLAFDHPEAKTIYDVQRELMAEITQRRGAEEQGRYIRSLMGEDITRQINAIGERLVTIAVLRYHLR